MSEPWTWEVTWDWYDGPLCGIVRIGDQRFYAWLLDRNQGSIPDALALWPVSAFDHELTRDELQVLMHESCPDLPDQPQNLSWTPWDELPLGSLSHDGDGHYLLLWPSADEKGLNMCWFVNDPSPNDDPENSMLGPDHAYDPKHPFRCPRGKMIVLRSGLTLQQIQIFVTHTPQPGSTPEQELAMLCGLSQES